jgi:hypothetical protein
VNLAAGGGGLLSLLVCLALLYILYRIPHWILASFRIGGGGRTLVGGLVKGFLMAKTFGALTNRHGSPRPAGDNKRIGRPASDPAWPAKIHAWYGVDGPRGLAAIEQRTRAWQASERAHRKPRSTVAPVRFQQATAQTPTHDLATRHMEAAPAATTFHEPVRPRTPAVPPRPASPPPPSTFRTARPATPPVPAMRTAAVPAALRFVPPTPAAPMHTARAGTAPAPVRFESPDTPAPVHRRARTHTPAPPVFRAPQPEPAPPAPTTFRAPRSPRSSAPRGEQ